MTSKTSRPYWRAYFELLDSAAPFYTHSYFSSITNPFKLRQFEVYRAAKPAIEQRPAFDNWWAGVYGKMETNRDETIRQVGAMLRGQQEEDNATGKLDKFWNGVEVHQAAEEDRLVNLRMTTDAKKDALMLKSRDSGGNFIGTRTTATSLEDGQSANSRSPTLTAEGSKRQRLNSGQALQSQVEEKDLDEAANEDVHFPPLEPIVVGEYLYEDANVREWTPPRKSNVSGEIPLVADTAAIFQHVDATGNDNGMGQLSENDLELLNSATTWFKKLTAKGIDQAIISMREDRFPIAWIHDLLYDRLKLLRKGVQATWDENSYTSLWVNLDLVALYTGVDDLMTHAFANENHFSPSAWRRSLVPNHPHSKGTNVDGFYAGKDGLIDIVVENVGSPSCSNYAKRLEDERKCWRNTADVLLERFYLSTGSFEVAKEYNVISMVIYGANLYQVKKIFHGQYHMNKDAYLVKLLVHLKLCLVIKGIMERNQDVATRFAETIDSLLPKDEQANFNLKLHATPSKKTRDM